MPCPSYIDPGTHSFSWSSWPSYPGIPLVLLSAVRVCRWSAMATQVLHWLCRYKCQCSLLQSQCLMQQAISLLLGLSSCSSPWAKAPGCARSKASGLHVLPFGVQRVFLRVIMELVFLVQCSGAEPLSCGAGRTKELLHSPLY